MEIRTRKQRSLVCLLVFLWHGLIIEALLRSGREVAITQNNSSEGLLVRILPRRRLPAIDALTPGTLSKAPEELHFFDGMLLPGPAPVPTNPSIAAPIPAPPPIDWQAQLELAAANGASEANERGAYRDLSKSMSQAQLDWLKRQHMEPASPGITWKTPRVEITQDGLPVIHVNDHCVLVPILLIPMIFCRIGHIEPNGNVFQHMNEPTH